MKWQQAIVRELKCTPKKGTMLDLFSFFSSIYGDQGTSKVLDMMSKDMKGAKKYVRELGVTTVKKNIVICFSNHEGCLGPLGSISRKTLGNIGKAQIFYF